MEKYKKVTMPDGVSALRVLCTAPAQGGDSTWYEYVGDDGKEIDLAKYGDYFGAFGCENICKKGKTTYNTKKSICKKRKNNKKQNNR